MKRSCEKEENEKIYTVDMYMYNHVCWNLQKSAHRITSMSTANERKKCSENNTQHCTQAVYIHVYSNSNAEKKCMVVICEKIAYVKGYLSNVCMCVYDSYVLVYDASSDGEMRFREEGGREGSREGRREGGRLRGKGGGREG